LIVAIEQELARARRLPSPALARELRRDAGLSQELVAQELGVHRVTLNRWERGRQHPSRGARDRWADLLSELRDVAP
jgi:transcriptional regulator with XRE-family HTH domain